MSKKGNCQKHSYFRGIIRVSDKGQVVIPAKLRQELDIKKGDRLVAVKRSDQTGLNLIKENTVQDIFSKLSGD